VTAMATQSHRRFMSYAEFEALPREGMITMLLDGEYVVLPSPKPRHQSLVGEIFGSIWGHLKAHPIGVVFPAPLDVVLSEEAARVIQPDVFVILTEHESRVEEARIKGLPDLAIEVLSRDANRYDKGKKLQYYDEYGIGELWHVDQYRPRVEVYRRDPAGRLTVARALGPGDTLETPLLPGFALTLDALYRERPGKAPPGSGRSAR